MANLIISAGQRFGKWMVIDFAGIFIRNIKPGQGGKTERRWRCRCTCGAEKFLSTRQLSTSRSCFSCINKTHGLSKTKEHSIWSGIIERCYYAGSKCYKDYGGRGITVCDRWREFVNFLSDMGTAPTPKHEIDRLDNNGPYEPGNCRWATRKENSRNRRNSHFVTFQDKTATVGEWAEITGFGTAVIYSRLKAGWSVEATLTAPIRTISPRS